MNEIYKCFCLFFTFSILPFLIVELFVQDYYTFEIISIFTIIILIVCVSINYLKAKFIPSPNNQDEKLGYLDQLQRKEKIERDASFYLRKNYKQ